MPTINGVEKEFAHCSCGTGFLAPIEKIGKKIKCPSCNKYFLFKEPFKIVKTDIGIINNIAHCSCGGKIKYNKNKDRKKAFCPECKTYHTLI